MLKSPRGLVAAGLGALLAIALIAAGVVYIFVFPSSAPKTLALSSSTSTPNSTASSSADASSGVAGTWTVASGSQAGYRVRETLAFVGAPSDAVGRTSSIHGSLTITGSGSSDTVSAASITVDVNTLTSDRSMRDQRIHSMGLQSDLYPHATFTLSSPIALPAAAGNGQIFLTQATGQLTIHGVTKTVTIPIQARLAGSQIQLAGSITFHFSEFGMTTPNVAGFVSVENNVTMEFAINFVHGAA